MDFGDILDEWDRQTAKAAGKKNIKAEEQAKNKQYTGSRGDQVKSGSVSEQKVDPLTAWLRIYGVQDKDRDSPDVDLSDAELRQLERKRLIDKDPDALLDLHGLTSDEAWDRLGHFFNQAWNQGAEKVLVIHGKGNHSEGEAVLKRTTKQFIEQCPFAGQYGHPSAAGGGSGATWVLLKRNFNVRDR